MSIVTQLILAVWTIIGSGVVRTRYWVERRVPRKVRWAIVLGAGLALIVVLPYAGIVAGLLAVLPNGWMW